MALVVTVVHFGGLILAIERCRGCRRSRRSRSSRLFATKFFSTFGPALSAATSAWCALGEFATGTIANLNFYLYA